MEASTLIAISGAILSFITFILTRLDKKEEKTKNNHQDLIEYQLKELKDDVKEILRKVDDNTAMTEKKVQDAIDLHVKIYHKGEK